MTNGHDPSQKVAAHYDDLDPLYRGLWGGHVHHGLWQSGRESPRQAADALSHLVARRAGISTGTRVCDVGCGYGETARMLAAGHGARVTAITVSKAQHDAAFSHDSDNPRFVLGDWLDNHLPDACFDAVIAIESTEHFPDLARGIGEMARVLVPGGRLVVCAWMSRPSASAWQRRHLLDPIRRHGCLVGMSTEADYLRSFADAGLMLDQAEDISRKVRRTWPHCIRRSLAAFARDPAARRFLLADFRRHRTLALTLLRTWIAYLTGSMHYVVFSTTKPGLSN